jgi:flagellar basal-body rod modification protein FlgD
MSATIAPSTVGAGAPAAGGKRSSIAGDFQTFLTLLTTQLQNQDPTNPLDTNQMTNQLVQFASVEQQIAMNQNLTRLISLQQASQVVAAAPLIGQRAEVEADRLVLQEGTATLRLPAAGEARAAEIVILDDAGRVLRQETIALGPEPAEWRWDGRDAMGRSLADGTYRVAVAGRGANGEALPLATGVIARITGAERQDGEIVLALGGLRVGFDSLRRLMPGK